jgi:hypothetical protein
MVTDIYLASLLLFASILLPTVAGDAGLTQAYRVEFRVPDIDTQCGEANGIKSQPEWLTKMADTELYTGLLEMGTMEDTGYFAMGPFCIEVACSILRM